MGHQWLIWSNEHCGWWRPNHAGYCYERKDAGRYSFEEACQIVKNANYALAREPNEAMVLDVGMPELHKAQELLK